MSDPVWRLGEHIAWVDSGDRVVVLDPSRPEDEPRTLSESASDVWRAIDGVHNDQEITEEVAAVYGVESAQIRADVGHFLEELGSLSLIERVASAP